ncbi:GTP 3',8-cyclase MoaA [candidate division KSB1 bacterium]|nr:GTP 3',8-cyclase MoaA [candidate division KSB1 bacterium]
MNKMIIQDKRNRILRDLRISVTDRCNFRCIYCMPREIYKKYNYLQHSELLTFEEIYRLVTIFSQLGVRKVRLTGGEPLVRKDLEQLIGFLNQIPDLDLSMTTNGSFPLERVHSLKNAGLKRITISLDSLDDGVFKKMNDVDQSVENTLLWISECEKIGLAPVKINTVIKRGVNEHSILPLVERFKNTPHILRFIEFMDVGTTNHWNMDAVVPAEEILHIIESRYALSPIGPNYPGEVARRYKYKNGQGELGIIASVTHAFCGGCTRMRLSAHGSLYLCLFANTGTDLRTLLRNGATDTEISIFIQNLWSNRTDNYSEQRSEDSAKTQKVEMPFIGG